MNRARQPVDMFIHSFTKHREAGTPLGLARLVWSRADSWAQLLRDRCDLRGDFWASYLETLPVASLALASEIGSALRTRYLADFERR
eukprot:655255-Alexandrium_andersonii.AAC.1